MKEQIIYREYQKSDHQALSAIIRKTWHYDEFAGPRTAAKMADVFLDSCLANQTFTKTAVADGRPVGIIMGKNIQTHKCPFSYWLKRTMSIASLLITKEGREVSKIFGGVDGIDRELLKSCPRTYQGEIALFAISPEYRGQGIGKKLYQYVQDYMRAEHMNDYYLFTDTSCNYRFYEHQGMERRCEKDHTFEVNHQTGKMTFFVYDYQF